MRKQIIKEANKRISDNEFADDKWITITLCLLLLPALIVGVLLIVI